MDRVQLFMNFVLSVICAELKAKRPAIYGN